MERLVKVKIKHYLHILDFCALNLSIILSFKTHIKVYRQTLFGLLGEAEMHAHSSQHGAKHLVVGERLRHLGVISVNSSQNVLSCCSIVV